MNQGELTNHIDLEVETARDGIACSSLYLCNADHYLKQVIKLKISSKYPPISIPEKLTKNAHLFISQLFTQVCHNMTKLSSTDETISILVKNSEGFPDLLLAKNSNISFVESNSYCLK